MENEIIINSRCVELFREYKSSWKLNESEFALCDRIGREIADLLPRDVRINPLHCSSAEKILQWVEAGRYINRKTEPDLPDERKTIAKMRKRKIRKIKASRIFWTSFFVGLSLFWIFIALLILRAL